MKQDKFFDEEIIDMMNRMENQSANAETSSSKESVQESGIYAGVKILGKWISFERHQLLNQEISMMIPQNFVPMSPDIAKRKYPSEQRPETILTDETGTINLMFQYMEGKESDSSIENFRNKIFGMMKRVNPGIKEQEMGAIDLPEKTLAYVEFTNPAIDGKLYNLMFYMAVNGQPLMGSFNCRTSEMKYWKPVAFEMVQSIEIKETQE